MTVLQVGKYFRPFRGGIETVTEEFIVGFRAVDIKSDVLCFNRVNRTEFMELSGSKVTKCSTIAKVASMPISFSFIWKLLGQSKNYDIVLLHMPNPLACFIFALFRPRSSLVLLWHSDVVKQRLANRLLDYFVRKTISRSRAVIGFTSAHIDNSMYSKLFVGKRSIIPYPFNIDEFLSKPKVALSDSVRSLGSIKRFVFALGRLTYYKGFQYLIEAISDIEPDISIVIGGTGELDSYLRRKADSSHHSDRIRFLGALSGDEVRWLMQRCSVFCLPSIFKSEMFGVVQLEAMASGKPVVSTRIPGSGVQLVNVDEVTGLTVAPRSSKALAVAINRLVGNGTKLKKFGIDLPQHIREHYNADKIFRQYRALFQSISKV